MKTRSQSNMCLGTRTPNIKHKLIIGLRGSAGSGKDTIANYLVQKYGFTKITFATPLKQITSIITGWPLEMLKGETEASRNFRETEIHPDFGFTARQMLQYFGTDLFRNHFDEEIWIKIARRQISETNENVVISDVRFPNEADIVQELGGSVWHLTRPIGSLKVPEHVSEMDFEVENETIIKNIGTLEDLYSQIDELIG